jgi:HlyD family secretion protein
MRRRAIVQRVSWIVAILLALATLVWALLPRPVEVHTAVAARGRLAATVSAEGKTRVIELYEVTAPVDGTLQRITVQSGDIVTMETAVARIAPIASRPLDPRTRSEAEAAVTAARAAVSRAEAAVRQAEAAAEHAESQLATARKMAERGAAPEQQAVHAVHEAQIRYRAVEEARAAARQARAELGRASTIVTAAGGPPSGVAVEVKSPADGRVLRVVRKSGGPVTAGTPLVEVGDVTHLEVVADLLSSDAARVELGVAATISDWGGAPVRARVRRVDPAAFTKISALGLEEQRVRVLLDLVDAPPPSLGHDYRVDVRIEVWRGDDVLQVPSTALFRHGDQWAVYAVRERRARLVIVDLGPTDGTRTVIERGLSPGAVVVTQPSDAVRDGVRVREIEALDRDTLTP